MRKALVQIFQHAEFRVKIYHTGKKPDDKEKTREVLDLGLPVWR